MKDETVTITNYDDDAIRQLPYPECVRLRPGMYIGRLGDGTQAQDGMYLMLKEIIDNSVDEFRSGNGDKIDITIAPDLTISVRDYGRGMPQGKLIEAVSQLHTGGKFDNKNFHRSVGMNGVGLKVVNALSISFEASSYRDGQVRTVTYSQGVITGDTTQSTDEPNGTNISFRPDESLFVGYSYQNEFIENMLRNYAYLNTRLTLLLNGNKYISRNGLLDLLTEALNEEPLYPIIHLKNDDIEIAITHTTQNGEEYHSFVNGQHTIQGGTHQSAFREHTARTIKEFFNKNQEYADIRGGIVAAIAVNIEEPVFESQTKIKLGSNTISPEKDAMTVNKFVGDFVKHELDNYLHRTPPTAEILLAKIISNEKERKEIDGVTKKTREASKKISLHNKKLRDCRIHMSDAKSDRKMESSIFLTEGDSASGSITKSRDPNTQAVFSLRGKLLNSLKEDKKKIYENEELMLLKAALGTDDGIENLRYNKIIIATDADVDGMHIRLLLTTFFLLFYPDVVKKGHLYVLQTPLFRVRNKKTTRYCYSEEERKNAIKELSPQPEITRFKGLGEISSSEFRNFIGENMRLEPITMRKTDQVRELMEFYMGNNTPARQDFLINNLVVEEDTVA